jgi:hypothetical protein
VTGQSVDRGRDGEIYRAHRKSFERWGIVLGVVALVLTFGLNWLSIEQGIIQLGLRQDAMQLMSEISSGTTLNQEFTHDKVDGWMKATNDIVHWRTEFFLEDGNYYS